MVYNKREVKKKGGEPMVKTVAVQVTKAGQATITVPKAIFKEVDGKKGEVWAIETNGKNKLELRRIVKK